MATCPKCHAQVTDTAKFCPECGNPLSKETSDPAWIAAMQEKIKDARQGAIFGSILALLGAICFAVLFIIDYTNFEWLILIVIIASLISAIIPSKRYKKLVAELEKGQKR